MRTRPLTILAVASTLSATLGGCGQPMDASFAEQSYGLQLNNSTHRDPRIHPVRRPGAETLAPSLTATAHLNYYGGHVMPSVKVVNVNWGSAIDATVQSTLPAFYTAVTNSAYLDWLSEYDTNIAPVGGGSGTNEHIGRGSYSGSYTISPAKTSGTIQDSAIQTELNTQIKAGKLPAADANTIYMVNFPKSMTINLGGSTSCSVFCAYHNTGTAAGGGDLIYSVLPFVGPGSACASGCGTDASWINNATSVASHELIEAITDPEIGLVTGASIDKPAAWYDETNGEIGDICNAAQGPLPGTSYVVQTEWSNKAGKCQIVAAGGSDTTAPTVALTAPSAGSTLSGTVTLTATASDPDDAVSKVDFYYGTTLIGSDTTSPYSVSWNTSGVANGTYSLTAKGTDSHGNVGTASAVSVVVSNGGTDLPPVVSLTAPASGSTLSGTVTLSANASDPDDSVAKVDFYYGTTLIGSDTASPYTLSWNTSAVANGSYSLTAKATDSRGVATTSTSVTVTVSNGGGTVQWESEPNNSTSAADSVNAGVVQGYISPAGESDYFKLSVAKGKAMSLDLTIPASVDYDLYIYDSSGTLLGKSENDGVGLAEHIDLSASTKARTLYIEVVGYIGSSATLPYKLNIALM